MQGSPPSSVHRITAAAPDALVFRAFNSVGWENMADPVLGGVQADLLYCGADDPAATAVVESLIADVGFRPVRVGGLDEPRGRRAAAPLVRRWRFAGGAAAAWRSRSSPTDARSKISRHRARARAQNVGSEHSLIHRCVDPLRPQPISSRCAQIGAPNVRRVDTNGRPIGTNVRAFAGDQVLGDLCLLTVAERAQSGHYALPQGFARLPVGLRDGRSLLPGIVGAPRRADRHDDRTVADGDRGRHRTRRRRDHRHRATPLLTGSKVTKSATEELTT